ncbi:MAG: hypothetical protein C0418_02495 [Coriobacteriaceae bacterium]|nr:hypothetical protein [Coriobacteriaceae bacterium]
MRRIHRQAHRSGALRSGGRVVPRGGGGVKILIVDDDQAARYLTASIVRSGGHEAVSASDGAEALEVARAQVFDVILSDILMPRMDGYQLARECKADSDLAAIPIVFLTASYTDPADERFALDLGAERFLTKPVEPDVLLDVLAELSEGATASHARGPRIEEQEILREYNERLVNKLERKVLELQEANRMLSAAMDTLSSELEVKSTLISELDGRVRGQVSDIEETMAARAVLEHAVQGASGLVMLVGDRYGRTEWVSKGTCLLTGYAEEELCGVDYFDVLVSEADRDARRTAYEALMTEGGCRTTDSEVLTRRGESVRLAWIDCAWRDDSGDICGVIGVGTPLR